MSLVERAGAGLFVAMLVSSCVVGEPDGPIEGAQGAVASGVCDKDHHGDTQNPEGPDANGKCTIETCTAEGENGYHWLRGPVPCPKKATTVTEVTAE